MIVDKDFVKEHVDIVTVVRDYVRLRKLGNRYVGICPFHVEKTASFSVSGRDQFFKCFGCDAKGDVFRFVMNIDGVSFPESVRSLADRFGLGTVASAPMNVIARRTSLFEDRQCCAWWWARQIEDMRGELDLGLALDLPPAPILIDRHDDGTATVTALGPVPEEYAWADCIGRMIRRAESLPPDEQMNIFRLRATVSDKAEYQRLQLGARAIESALSAVRP